MSTIDPKICGTDSGNPVDRKVANSMCARRGQQVLERPTSEFGFLLLGAFSCNLRGRKNPGPWSALSSVLNARKPSRNEGPFLFRAFVVIVIGHPFCDDAGPACTRDHDTNHRAICWTENISAPNLSYARSAGDFCSAAMGLSPDYDSALAGAVLTARTARNSAPAFVFSSHYVHRAVRR